MSRRVRRHLQKYFRRIVVLDFEYEVEPGDLPNVLCLVAYILNENLQHIETIRRWRGEFGTSPPFPVDDDTLIVGYSLWAELTCFGQLGWRFPKHVYDLHTAYLSVSNILLPFNPDETRIKQRNGLSYACRAYGIDGWEKIDKPEMAKAIGEGRWRDYGQPMVFTYCQEDVSNSAELLRRQISGYCNYAPIDPQLVMTWSTYSAKTVARIQAAGMPIDVPLWNLVQENKAAVVAALIARFDPSQGNEYPIYSPEGEFSSWRFEQWLISVGVTYWPRLDSGALQLRWRRLSPDVLRTSGDRGAACAPRQPWRHRPCPDPDRTRRPQPAESFPFWYGYRSQCPEQVALQRPRGDALVHDGFREQDPALPGLAHPGGWCCRGT